VSSRTAADRTRTGRAGASLRAAQPLIVVLLRNSRSAPLSLRRHPAEASGQSRRLGDRRAASRFRWASLQPAGPHS
jgi:hypothetical protein